MKLGLKTLTLLIAILAVSSTAFAVPSYYLANGLLPTDLAVLQAERALWQGAFGGTLATEGFESFAPGNPINFGGFTSTLSSGSGFSQLSGNNLITTEGNSVMSFNTTGATSVEFAFGSGINAFGVDITSIDFVPTTVSFLDDLGNSLSNFAIQGQFAGATFFGVTNTQSFSSVRFDFGGTETLNFDNLQYGGQPVPEPGTLVLFGLGLAGAARGLRRKRANKA